MVLSVRLGLWDATEWTDGPGRLLVSSVSYWRYRLFDEKPELAHSAAAAM
jgi:hypothetical protein